MKKTLTFHIEEKAETLQEGTFKVPSGCLTLTFVHDLDEAFAFLVVLLIRDPQGNLRLQKQLAHRETWIRRLAAFRVLFLEENGRYRSVFLRNIWIGL